MDAGAWVAIVAIVATVGLALIGFMVRGVWLLSSMSSVLTQTQKLVLETHKALTDHAKECDRHRADLDHWVIEHARRLDKLEDLNDSSSM